MMWIAGRWLCREVKALAVGIRWLVIRIPVRQQPSTSPPPSPFLPPSFLLRLSLGEVDSVSVPSDKTKNRGPLCYMRAHAEAKWCLMGWRSVV